MEWYNMANILIVKKSTLITVKKIEGVVPSRKVIYQEIPIVLTTDTISVVLAPVEEITV
jgi:hypothetical protein